MFPSLCLRALWFHYLPYFGSKPCLAPFPLFPPVKSLFSSVAPVFPFLYVLSVLLRPMIFLPRALLFNFPSHPCFLRVSSVADHFSLPILVPSSAWLCGSPSLGSR